MSKYHYAAQKIKQLSKPHQHSEHHEQPFCIQYIDDNNEDDNDDDNNDDADDAAAAADDDDRTDHTIQDFYNLLTVLQTVSNTYVQRTMVQ